MKCVHGYAVPTVAFLLVQGLIRGLEGIIPVCKIIDCGNAGAERYLKSGVASRECQLGKALTDTLNQFCRC